MVIFPPGRALGRTGVPKDGRAGGFPVLSGLLFKNFCTIFFTLVDNDCGHNNFSSI